MRSDLIDDIKNADPYADPDHVCDLIVEVVDEIERLSARLAEVVRGRDALIQTTEANFRQWGAATARAAVLEAALRRQHENIQRWLETGEPASAEESKSIADQIAAALELAKEPQG